MTKNEKYIVENIARSINHIINYHNKNLTNTQLWCLTDVLGNLKLLLGKQPNEMIQGVEIHPFLKTAIARPKPC